MILKQRAGASGSSASNITGIRNEAEHQITFQMDYDNAVVVLKQYRKSDEVTITTACELIVSIECSTLLCMTQYL